ncbi:MAG: hypothetical protein Phog2KO_03930 [Phototrophicaceae bacterium]
MSENTLQYLSGRGWIILSGGNTSGSPIRAKTLTRAREYGITAYISSADDGGDSLLDDMEDLGARSGYFIDPEYDEPEDIIEEMKTASVIVVEVGSSIDNLYKMIKGATIEGIRQAYERGGVVLIEGLAVNLFGRWVVSDQGEILEGLNWIHNAFIEPQSTGAEDSRAVQAVLNEMADAIAINIDSGSALALGPDGAVEVWGEDKKVTISLGSKYIK